VSGRLIIGDALAELRKLEAESVHMCATSPPYWGLRDYGAKGQLGLEKTPEQHVGAMVAVFEEVRRVLRSDGTLWLNYGDSYATQRNDHDWLGSGASAKKGWHGGDLKPKDLVGMPWRVAFALQAAGWYLRSDIIWHKPNPMPESVTDRPTSAHEYLFLLAKAPRYFYDADAIREAHEMKPQRRSRRLPRPSNRQADSGFEQFTRSDPGIDGNPAGRNKRSVWTVATQPYSGAHFATFPPKLITPCIMAGTSERGCCSSCGAPWVRAVDKAPGMSASDLGIDGTESYAGHHTTKQGGAGGEARKSRLSGERLRRWREEHPHKQKGWQPSCKCDVSPEPCTVLDPFGGSGTVAEVCEALGRRWVLIELNPDYEPLIRQRTAQRGLFAR
jgi:DNA modification methylase